MPIALMKGMRMCTQHPISNLVSYEGLSPSYKAFATTLIEIQIPKNIQEALSQPKCKKAVLEEVHALEKTRHGSTLSCLQGRNWLDANGYSRLNTMLMEV